MVGYPKTLNTKEDYLYVRDNFPKSEWEQDFQNLLDTRYDWFYDSELAEGDEGVTDDTHRVVEMREGDESVKRAQYVLKENPTCRMNQLGFTEDEIKKILEDTSND